MFHNGDKRKPLNFIFHWGWEVQVAIMTINFFFIRSFSRVSINIFSYPAASRLSFHYWSNAVWLISFNRITSFALNMLIIVSFLSLNYVLIQKEFKLLFPTKFLSVFDEEVIVLIHVINLSESSVSSAWNFLFTSFGSLPNYYHLILEWWILLRNCIPTSF